MGYPVCSSSPTFTHNTMDFHSEHPPSSPPPHIPDASPPSIERKESVSRLTPNCVGKNLSNDLEDAGQ